MKKAIYKIIPAAFAALLVFGCTNNAEYKDVAVYPVSTLSLPTADYYVELQSGTDRQVTFSWGTASADDGMLLQYELLFFSAPTGGTQIAMMDAGMKNSITLTHKDLNKMMGGAGIGSGETGAMYWTVKASRGPNSAMYTGTPRKLNIRRMVGFDEIPAKLYMTGSASETGTVLADSREFKLTSAAGDEGEYEMYTEITSGTFNFVSALDGSGRTFGVENGLLEETTTGSTYAPGIYRINVDFSVKGIIFTKISEVRYTYMQNTGYNSAMPYVGGGVWQLLDFELKLDRPGWGTRGFEERYRFEVSTSDGTEVWGPYDTGLDSAPSSLNFNGDYFTTVARGKTGDWDPKWKWYTSAVPDKNAAAGADNPYKHVNLYVDMSNTGGRYFHHYTVLE